MAEPLTRVPLCTVAGCPYPSDPDWHVPICKHGLEGHHHHVVKRSQGGKEGMQVFICPKCHDLIDNGPWGNAVIEAWRGEGKHWDYCIFDVMGKQVCCVEVTQWVVGEGGQRRASGDRKVARATRAQQPHSLPSLSDQPQDILVPDNDWIERQALLAQQRPQEAILSGPSAQAVATVNPWDEGRLSLPENLPRERFREIVHTLLYMKRNIDWLLGDAIVYGEQNYGEECYQDFGGFEEIGFGIERLKQCAWVAERIPPTTRVLALSWTAHRIVAALPEPERAELLARAESEGLTTRELREAIQQASEPAGEPEGCQHEWLCQKCGERR